jgi:HAD superfamily hydrolase (TIGR01509 family)
VEYLESARRLGLRLAVASSSPRSWVAGHLERLRLIDHFEALACGDEVPRTKPDPAVYQAALAALGLGPQEVIALEDSPNGSLAASRAGIFCVAVPHELTRSGSFAAELQVDSLTEMSLEELLALVADFRTRA